MSAAASSASTMKTRPSAASRRSYSVIPRYFNTHHIMKNHAIIPIFIPHHGCKNQCVFCNQHVITARSHTPGADEIEEIIDTWLGTLERNRPKTIEIAFFGGSFTGIPVSMQSECLSIAKKYKDAGRIDKIHMSTRPDYISENILNNLKHYDADTIELGVQSFDPEVLMLSKRGHSAEDTEKACRLIHEYGFELGIQLMTGLPGDTREKAIYSAEKAVEMKPSIARIYPTVVLENTELNEMYKRGEYIPPSEKESVETAAEVYKVLASAGIQIIRVGLKSTDLVTNSSDASGEYHPAFRQLVEGHIALEKMEAQLNSNMSGTVTFTSNPKSFSNMIGHKGVNRKHLHSKYPDLEIKYMTDSTLSDYEYLLT